MDDKRNKTTGSSLKAKLISLIADNIKKADDSYFFENYTKQARAVLRALDREGYVLLPKKPTKDMLRAGVLAISIGNIDASKLARDIYNDMLEADD
jgi:hypothetical protein